MKSAAIGIFPILLFASCATRSGNGEGNDPECYVVDHANTIGSNSTQMNESDSNMLQANAGHMLEPGSRTIFSVRLFDQKDGVVDSQYFTKITGYLNPDTSLSQTRLLVEDVHFSSGWSGFAYKGDYWLAKNISVEVNNVSKKDNLVEMSLSIDGYNSFRRESKIFDLNISCMLTKKALKNLTPWQGGAGKAWDSFYRKS